MNQKAIKLGHTDIEPADRRFAVNHARRLFLDAIKQHAPAVLNELAIVENESEFCRWIEKYNLNADWLINIAAETINARRLFPTPEIHWFPVSSGWQMPDVELPQLPNGLPAWTADVTPRAVYLSDVQNIIKNELTKGFFADLPQNEKSNIKTLKTKIAEKYCDEVIKRHLKLRDERGEPVWIATTDKRNLKRDAVWTVKSQIQKQDFAAIARTEKIQRPTIQKTVESFLELIDLEKRPTSRGRRNGQRDSQRSDRQITKNRQTV